MAKRAKDASRKRVNETFHGALCFPSKTFSAHDSLNRNQPTASNNAREIPGFTFCHNLLDIQLALLRATTSLLERRFLWCHQRNVSDHHAPGCPHTRCYTGRLHSQCLAMPQSELRLNPPWATLFSIPNVGPKTSAPLQGHRPLGETGGKGSLSCDKGEVPWYLTGRVQN